jgi:hypothetical protein
MSYFFPAVYFLSYDSVGIDITFKLFAVFACILQNFTFPRQIWFLKFLRSRH